MLFPLELGCSKGFFLWLKHDHCNRKEMCKVNGWSVGMTSMNVNWPCRSGERGNGERGRGPQGERAKRERVSECVCVCV